jgi:choline dehydrogenase-like flavoprotein
VEANVFLDARELPTGTVVETDVCIVGAGAAGITIARELAGSRFRVCLLESGGLDYDPQVQDMYKGSNIGRDYYDLDVCRLRYFGGTTNHWAGWCRPLEAIDFEKRSWIPHSGWPFGFGEIEPYYPRAYEICQVPSPEVVEKITAAQVTRGDSPVSDDGRVVTLTAQFSPPTRFGEVYRSELRAASGVSVYLNANVVNIDMNDVARSVVGLDVATLDGNSFRITGRHFILAAGGIENPRLMLACNKVQTAGIGNRYDLVGRFFMEHPEPPTGLFMPTRPHDPKWAAYDKSHREASREPLRLMSLHPSILEREQLLNSAVGLGHGRSEAWAAARRLILAFKKREMPEQFASDLYSVISDLDGFANDAYYKFHGAKTDSADVFSIDSYCQQAPNPDSRVTLAAERDALGLPRANLDWRLTELDRHTVRRTLEIVGAELGRLGLGRVKVDFEDWPDDFLKGNHHIGTTRMSDDPKLGVVDASCRVHDIQNLFIAGSSVFPTAGSAAPTLTIVAMALRLAEHLKQIYDLAPPDRTRW